MNDRLLDKITLDRKDELILLERLTFFKSDISEGWLLDGMQQCLWIYRYRTGGRVINIFDAGKMTKLTEIYRPHDISSLYFRI